MAILTGGILGNIRNKVGGVVGSQWKHRNTLRSYVIPGNPDTAAQQVQRNKFAAAVAFAKLILGQVLNVYVDPFQKQMSGFNFFIKQNIAYFAAEIVWASVKVTFGKLYGPLNAAFGTLIAEQSAITWDTDTGSNGAADDKVFAMFYNITKDLIYFAGAEVNRSAGTLTIDIPGTEDQDDCYMACWASKYDASGSLVMVSDSVVDSGTIAD
jgi:hypothetical protein